MPVFEKTRMFQKANSSFCHFNGFSLKHDDDDAVDFIILYLSTNPNLDMQSQRSL